MYESSNDASYHNQGEIVLSAITDHLPGFGIKSSKMKKSKPNNDYHFRDMTNFDPEIFAEEMHLERNNLVLPNNRLIAQDAHVPLDLTFCLPSVGIRRRK